MEKRPYSERAGYREWTEGMLPLWERDLPAKTDDAVCLMNRGA